MFVIGITSGLESMEIFLRLGDFLEVSDVSLSVVARLALLQAGWKTLDATENFLGRDVREVFLELSDAARLRSVPRLFAFPVEVRPLKETAVFRTVCSLGRQASRIFFMLSLLQTVTIKMKTPWSPLIISAKTQKVQVFLCCTLEIASAIHTIPITIKSLIYSQACSLVLVDLLLWLVLVSNVDFLCLKSLASVTATWMKKIMFTITRINIIPDR